MKNNKKVYIINNYKIIDDREITVTIEAKTEQNILLWKYIFKDIKCSATEIMENFFMELYDLQVRGYSLIFEYNNISRRD